MRYYIARHQNKADFLVKALNSCGHTFVHRNAEVALFDHDLNRTDVNAVRSDMRIRFEEGSTIVLYPHGATGSWWLDGSNLNPMVFASLVIGEGHRRFMEIVQPGHRVEAIGWYYCPIKPFESPAKINRILFAPIHPTMGGTLRPEAIEGNRVVYDTLLKHIGRRQLVVRHIGKIENSGLWQHNKPIFKAGKTNGNYSDIDTADLVIAEGTYMYMAVARGKPTIGINQHLPIRPNVSPDSYKPKHWDEYKKFMPYPINFEGGSFEDLIEYARVNEQSEWKQLFIGKQLSPKRLSEILLSIRGESVRQKLLSIRGESVRQK